MSVFVNWLPVIRKNYHQVVLVFAAFTVMVLAGYFFVRGILSNRLLVNSKDALTTAEANVRAAFAESEVSLLNAANTVQDMIEDGADNAEILAYLKRTNRWLRGGGSFVGLYGLYGFIRGELIDALDLNPGPDYIPQARPWYAAALQSGGATAYTQPYTDARTGETIITAVRSITAANGEFYGVLALDLNMSWVGEYAKNLRMAPGGYGMILSQYLAVIFHPDESLRGIPMHEVGGNFIDLARRLYQGEEISGERIINYAGVPVIAFFRPIYNGWYLGLLTPVRAYYRDLSLAAFILGVTGLVMALLLSFVLLRVSAARMKADEENVSKTSFLARMSHEIRTPMNAIIGMSELTLREQITPQVRDYVGNIRQAGNNLLSIINDILDFSKIESGRLEIANAEYRLASILNDVVNIISMRMGENPVLFLTKIDSFLPNVLYGDDMRIRQALLNLLSNSVKYTRDGNITLSVYGESTEDGGKIRLVFEIADTGIGIKNEDMEKLFGEFQQFDVKHNRGIEGTGLGLAITRSLCQLMGGDITVKSVYGQGSVFTASVIQTVRDAASLAEVERPETKSVLVYDDRQAQARSLVYTLDNLGAGCSLVNTAAELDELLDGREWQFVVTSPALCNEVEAALKEKRSAAVLVLLAEYGEVVRRDLSVIAMPVLPWTVADVLNGKKTGAVYGETKDTGARFIAPGARVLVVDDIATNLMVASGLLAPYQMNINTAAGGLEAVHLAQQNRYDLILMDHMMPGVDGIEAAARIRAGEDAQTPSGETPGRVPIIALTANAVSGMKEMFLEKGFNDFISKPIDVSKLDDLIDRWIPKEKREKRADAGNRDGANAALSDNTMPPPSVLTIPGVDVQQGIAMTGGTEAGYRQVLAMFRKDAAERLPLLQNPPEPDALPLFVTQVHALKSASASIGAAEISAQAARLEAAGKAGDMAPIHENLPAFAARLAELAEGIADALGRKEEIDTADRLSPTPHSPLPVSLFKELAAALESQKTDAIDRILEELSQKITNPPVRETLDAVSDHVLMAEFDKALDRIKPLTVEETGAKYE